VVLRAGRARMPSAERPCMSCLRLTGCPPARPGTSQACSSRRPRMNLAPVQRRGDTGRDNSCHVASSGRLGRPPVRRIQPTLILFCPSCREIQIPRALFRSGLPVESVVLEGGDDADDVGEFG
jgi:hypothetical protein